MDPIWTLLNTFGFIICSFIFNFIIAEFASRRFYSLWTWMILFIFLPGLSHLFFLILWILWKRSEKKMEVVTNITFNPKRPENFLWFTGPVGPDYTKLEPSMDDLRDRQVDEVLREQGLYDLVPEGSRDMEIDVLIAESNWDSALDLAEKHLKNAKMTSDQNRVEIYRHYVNHIRPKLIKKYM